MSRKIVNIDARVRGIIIELEDGKVWGYRASTGAFRTCINGEWLAFFPSAAQRAWILELWEKHGLAPELVERRQRIAESDAKRAAKSAQRYSRWASRNPEAVAFRSEERNA